MRDFPCHWHPRLLFYACDSQDFPIRFSSGAARFSNDAGMVLILAVDLQVQRLAAFKFHLSGTRLQ